MRSAVISGTGMYVPEKVVTNDDLRTEYGIETDNDWIVRRTGIEARRFAPEGIGSADLALPAAEQAIGRAGLETKDIGMILFATLSPEHCFPGSGVYLQEKLGMPQSGHFVGALDIRNQCSGFLYGLGTAASMVQAGAVDHVLVVGGETHSAALDLSTRGRTVASLFGDGAGAVVVSASDDPARGIRTWKLGADGRFADVLAQRVWDVRKRPFIPVDENGVGQVQPEMMWAQMDGKLVFKNAVERMIMALMEVCWKEGITTNDIDLFAFHQANLRINQYVAKQLSIPEEKLLQNIHKFGNTTAATIPTLLAEAEETGRLQKGMKVACVAFGSGFTWGAAIIDW
ncbi:MAG: beta-ketoacyl-ACP synthase 3 [Alphaproteobacteria bacterium]|nr:beta-ketoacyl-ACP synthase 3 [Alphaproteobacteria bacterium]